ncbi:MAG: cytochrome c [Zavarzinia sp.]|nr:cytochrome c [Zavarzinia sp.]
MASLTLHFSRYAFAATLALGAVVGTAFAVDAGAAYEKREAAMKEAGGALKALGGAAKAGTVTPDDVAKAQALADFAAALPGLFPEGTMSDKSRALADIWDDPGAFEAKVKEFAGAADTVLAAAKSGDAAALGAAVGATGPTCGGCHKMFRGPEKN